MQSKMRVLLLVEKTFSTLILGLLIRMGTCGVQKDMRGHFLEVKRSFFGEMLVSWRVIILIFLYFFNKLAVNENFEGVANPFTFKEALCNVIGELKGFSLECYGFL